MILLVLAVFVVAGVLAHLLFTGVALGGLRTVVRELRAGEYRSSRGPNRVRDLEAAPRRAMYAMYGFWVAVTLLVVALGVARLV